MKKPRNVSSDRLSLALRSSPSTIADSRSKAISSAKLSNGPCWSCGHSASPIFIASPTPSRYSPTAIMPASPRTWCAEPSESADANLEQPEKRQFKKRPLGLIQANRGTYIAAALTTSLAYLATPRSLGLAPLASFEEWCRAVREPLVWVDCGDPVASQEKLRTEDPRMIEKTAIFEAWKARIGVGAHRACYTKELIATAGSDDAL